MITTMYRVDPKANMARFYALSLQPTLFGEWALVREWGRIGQRSCSLLNTYADLRAASQAGETLIAAKRKKGYCS
jgi:predicted DNA-binding WGR domain protein